MAASHPEESIEETENTEGVARPQAAAERRDSWSAGGLRELWDPRAHPGMLLSMTWLSAGFSNKE